MIALFLSAQQGLPSGAEDRPDYKVLFISPMREPGYFVSVSLEHVGTIEELEVLICRLLRTEPMLCSENGQAPPSLHILFFWGLRSDQVGQNGRVLPQLVRNHLFAVYTKRAWEPGPGTIRYRGRFQTGRAVPRHFDHIKQCSPKPDNLP